MSKIVVKQTCIEINNYELGDCPKLERVFSIYDMTYHTYFMRGMIYDQKNKKLLVPKGIDIPWLENALYESAVIDYSFDEFDYTEPIMLKYAPRDDIQREAIHFMIGEGKYNINKAIPTLSVNLNTGKGKTYCSIAMISYFCMKSIIITSSIEWLQQWNDFILEYTDIDKSEICFISGTPSINKLIKKGSSNYKIFLVSHSTIKNYGDKNGWDKVRELFKILRLGIKIFDEAHLNFDNMAAIDLYTNVARTYYVTATPMRSDDGEDRIYQLYMKNIPAIDLFDEDNDPRTKYISIRFNSHPTPIEASDCKNQYGLDRNKYTNYIVHKDNFYNVLHILIDKISRVNGKVLIYIGTNNAIAIVKQWIINNYPSLADDIGVYTSVVTENKKEQLQKKIILSTTKSSGAATDIKDLKMTIVLAEPFKSKVLARQTLGRTRDRDTIYIDIVDDGFYYTKRYYYAKQEIFEKYATECVEIKLPDEQLIPKAEVLYQEYLRRIVPCTMSQELIVPASFGPVCPAYFV